LKRTVIPSSKGDMTGITLFYVMVEEDGNSFIQGDMTGITLFYVMVEEDGTPFIQGRHDWNNSFFT